MTKEIKILTIILLAFVFLGGLLFFIGPKQHVPSQDAGRLVRDDADMTGNKDAKVTLVEFGDFQCPFCASVHPEVKQIIENYQGNPNFNFVFRNFPLPQHKYAKIAAEAAEAAGAQGQYWQMHDLIYQNQNSWASSNNALNLFVSYAQSLGLDKDQFIQDVQTNKYQDKIQADLDDGNALGVNSTPTLYLNGVQIKSNADFSTLKSQIDAELNK